MYDKITFPRLFSDIKKIFTALFRYTHYILTEGRHEKTFFQILWSRNVKWPAAIVLLWLASWQGLSQERKVPHSIKEIPQRITRKSNSCDINVVRLLSMQTKSLSWIFQIKPSHPFGAEPFSVPRLTYCQLYPWKKMSEIDPKYIHLH